MYSRNRRPRDPRGDGGERGARWLPHHRTPTACLGHTVTSTTPRSAFQIGGSGQDRKARTRRRSRTSTMQLFKRVELDEIVAGLERSGYAPKEVAKGHRALCPFPACADHQNPTRHRSLWVSKGYHCHRCDAKGDHGTLAEVLGIPRKPQSRQPQRSGKAGALDVLVRRLGPRAESVLSELDICLVQPGSGEWALKIPAGRRTRFKSLNGGAWWDSPGKNSAEVPEFLGHEKVHLDSEGILYVVEGETDWLAARAAGLSAITGTKGAGTIPRGLKQELSHLEGLKMIRILYDQDVAGRRGGWSLAHHLLRSGLPVEFLGWPADRRHGWDLADEWSRSRHQPDRLRYKLGDLPRVPVPGSPPPGGIYTPELDDGWFEPPYGYALSPHGTFASQPGTDGQPARWEQVCPAPLWVEGVQRNAESGEITLRLATSYDGQTVRQTIGRGAAFDSSRSGLPQLASKGFPIATRGAARIVAYLEAAEKQNLNHSLLPRGHSTWRCGWVFEGDRPTGIIVGRDLIGASIEDDDVVELDPERASHTTLYDSLKPRGVEAEWAKILTELTDHPYALLGVVASATSPLFAILESRDAPVLDWSGLSSTGKTTVLRLASSLWGDPTHDLPTWNATRFAIEVRAAVMRHLPIILDEHKSNRLHSSEIRQVVLDLASGTGRSSGQKNMSLRQQDTWRAIVLSTGNYPLADRCEDTAVQTRVFSLRSDPFPEGSGELVRGLLARIARHHGHAGRTLMRRILTMSTAEREVLRTEAQGEQARLIELIDVRDRAGPVERRAEWWAALYLGARLLSDEYPTLCGQDVRSVLDSIWLDLTRPEEQVPHELHALEVLLDHIAGHPHQIAGERGRAPQKGEVVGVRRSGVLSFRSLWLRNFLRDEGYDPRQILDRWHKRGWISGQPDGGYTKKSVRFGPHDVTSGIELQLPKAEAALEES